MTALTPGGFLAVPDYLARAAATSPNQVALVLPAGRRTRTLTMADLHSAMNRLAAGFAAAGVRAGARVAVLVPPSEAFFTLTFALLKTAAVPVLIDPGMGVRGLKRCLGEADVAAFVGVPKAHLARRLLGWARSATLTVNVGRGRWFCTKTLAELANSEAPFNPPPLTSDTPAAILFTSGSTGPAKGVSYTHGIFAAQIEALRAMFQIQPGEVDLCTFPLFALFGPALGMTCVVPRMNPTRPATASPRMLCRQMNEWQVTNFFGSPAVLRNWHAEAARCEPVPTLRRVISAGAPATTAVVLGVAKLLPRGVEVFTPYGATEALPVACVGSQTLAADTAAQTRAGRGVCVGRPVPGMQVRVIRQTADAIPTWNDALVMPAGDIGEFVVAGPVVTGDYFRRPEATRLAKIADPVTGQLWHRMGDMGYLDATGRLWMCGRKSHVVWTPAGPLYPDQVEPIFHSIQGVTRAALVGVTRGAATVPVVCVETGVRRGMWAQLRSTLHAEAARHALTQSIAAFLPHPAFPLDVRHNSKIFREQLAVWADGVLGPKWRPPGEAA